MFRVVLTFIRLFLLFVVKFAEIPCLRAVGRNDQSEKPQPETLVFTEDDDVDLCLYYLRTLHHVLECSGDASRAVLVAKHLSFNAGGQVQITSMNSLPRFSQPILLTFDVFQLVEMKSTSHCKITS